MVELQTLIRVQVCYAECDRQIVLDTAVPADATLHQAIKASGILEMVEEIDLSVWRVGIFGKLKDLDALVREQDRVEIYRPLIADPMESRRRRAAKRRA